MTLAHPQSEEELIEKARAVVRRLQAALIPSVFRARPPDHAVVREIRAILDSDGVQLLLAQIADGYFRRIIHKAQACVRANDDDRDVIERLWNLIDDPVLNRAIASDDAGEQPAQLVRQMLDGPYRDALERTALVLAQPRPHRRLPTPDNAATQSVEM
jgi:hypothetical protein